MNISNKKSTLLLVLALFAFAAYFYHSTISLFPAFMHSWTQSDRYALALGFINNGFDFFHPQTYNWMVSEGITRVDFPINDYLVACAMKLFGTNSFTVFRMYTLTVSIVGLVYLYLLAKKITSSEIKSVMMVFFVFLSPIYVYYQDGFIPTIPAISFSFIAYYYLCCYHLNINKKDFALSILFFTLAALVRMPFIILLLVTVVQFCWKYLLQKKINIFETIVLISGIGIFVSYNFYNIHLGRMYGTSYLDHIMPPKNMAELMSIISEMFNHWLFHYFSIGHYVLLLLLFSVSVYGWKRKKSKPTDAMQWKFHFFLLFSGAFCYFLLMAQQYFAHDYYFLDSFFVPIVLVALYSMRFIAIETPKAQTTYAIVGLVLIGAMTYGATKTQTERYATGPWDRTEITRQNFIGTEAFLDKMGISKEAKILVIDAYTTNVPLILMKRNGYTVLKTSYKEMSTSMFWCDWDYVAIQDNYLVSDVIKNYPFITSLLDRVGGTGKVSFYKRSKKTIKKSLKDFLAISSENTLFTTNINFDEPLFDTIHVKGCDHITTVNPFSVPNAGLLDSTIEYGTTLVIKAKELKNIANLKVLINGAVWSNQEFKEVQIVASVTNPKTTVFYQNFQLSDYVKPIQTWQHIEFQFVLPAFQTKDDELKIYLWNPKKVLACYDDWEVIIYK
ncbi:MAG: glycosyltransferase family 39 protein [Bacteroidota bacterium]